MPTCRKEEHKTPGSSEEGQVHHPNPIDHRSSHPSKEWGKGIIIIRSKEPRGTWQQNSISSLRGRHFATCLAPQVFRPHSGHCPWKPFCLPFSLGSQLIMQLCPCQLYHKFGMQKPPHSLPSTGTPSIKWYLTIRGQRHLGPTIACCSF